jgi:hypothetical protein
MSTAIMLSAGQWHSSQKSPFHHVLLNMTFCTSVLSKRIQPTRWVMSWVLLAMAITMATAMVHPPRIELICAGAGGMKLLQDADNDDDPDSRHSVDCALCPTGATPAPTLGTKQFSMPSTPSYQQPSLAHQADSTASSAPPLPARGPPRITA